MPPLSSLYLTELITSMYARRRSTSDIVSDCQGSLKTLQRARKGRRPKGAQGHITAAYSWPSIRERTEARWVHSHSELNQSKIGRWSPDDWGMWLSDGVAGREMAEGTYRGKTITSLQVVVATLLLRVSSVGARTTFTSRPRRTAVCSYSRSRTWWPVEASANTASDGTGIAPKEGDVLRPGRFSMSGLHRGKVTGLTREVAMIDGEVLELVQLAAEPKGELTRKAVSISNKSISVKRPDTETSAGISALTSLLQRASKVYTDGTYSVVGPLIDRIKGIAVRKAAAGIVAQYPDGSYAALRLDLTGQVSSAAGSELMAAVLADKAGTTHRDQITDCKSLLAIDAKLKLSRPMQYHQRSLMACRETGTVELRWNPDRGEEVWRG